MPYIYVGPKPQNLSSRLLTNRDSNQSPQLQGLAREISPVASYIMILSNKQITKALIRLCGCAAWSSPLLFPNSEDRFEDRFSRIEAHIINLVRELINMVWTLH